MRQMHDCCILRWDPRSVYLQCCLVLCVLDAFSPSLTPRSTCWVLTLPHPSLCGLWEMDGSSLSRALVQVWNSWGRPWWGDGRDEDGGERGRSYKLRRNSGYLTPACLSSTINHAQELRCVLSLLWPSAALIHLHSFSCFFSLLR